MDAVLCAFLVVATGSPGATVFTHTTANFVVTAPSAEFAEQVGVAAEEYRQELSLAWTGKVMPRWAARCPITVKVGQLGSCGATTFQFDRGEVYGWHMQIQGTAERILDSVLPHEINHTVFACYFRRPLPRWADEGAASLIEHESERLRLKKLHEQVMNSSRKIPLRKLLGMKEYPTDNQQVLTLYAEGYSLADFLIQQSDRRKYLQFLTHALENGWERALRDHYGYDKIESLEKDLDEWILAGSPSLTMPDGTLVAARGSRRSSSPTIRGQSPEWQIELGEPGDWPRKPAAKPAMSATGSSHSRELLEAPVSRVPVQLAAETGRKSRVGLTQPSLSVPDLTSSPEQPRSSSPWSAERLSEP